MTQSRAGLGSQSADYVAPSRLVLADALKTLAQHIEFHEQRNMLVRDLTYTIRRMIEDKGCKAPWAEMLQRHLARIDGSIPAPSPMDTCTICGGADGPCHEHIDGSE